MIRKQYENWNKEMNNIYGKNNEKSKGIIEEVIVTVFGEGNISCVKMEDYLDVVEELKQSQLSDKSKEESNIKIYNELKEKDEEIEVLNNTINVWKKEYEILCKVVESKDKTNYNLREKLEKKNGEIEKAKDINVNLVFENKEIKQNNEVLLSLIEGKSKEIDNLNYENENWKDSYKKLKDANERMKERIEKADSRVDSYEEWHNNNVNEFNKMKEENERLKKHNEVLKNLDGKEKQYEEWCILYYTFKSGKNIKQIKQNMLLEHAFELIGMDSDNWIDFTVEKYKKEVK